MLSLRNSLFSSFRRNSSGVLKTANSSLAGTFSREFPCSRCYSRLPSGIPKQPTQFKQLNYRSFSEKLVPKVLNLDLVKSIYDNLEKACLYPVIGGGLATMAYTNGLSCTDCSFNFGVKSEEFHHLEAIVDGNPKYEWWNSNIKVTKVHLRTTPIISSLFKSEGFLFHCYFDSNFATEHAFKNCRVKKLGKYNFRLLPPESLCFFKFLEIDEFAGTYGKHFFEVDSILQHLTEGEIDNVDAYVSASLSEWNGKESKQLKMWRKMITRQWLVRSNDTDSEFDEDLIDKMF